MRIKLGTPLRLNVIPKATKGVCATTIPHLQVVEYLTTSSNEVEKGDLFVALKGEHADGNDWIEDAIKNGASAILYSKEYQSAHDTAYMIHVEDTLHGLENLAKYYSRLFPHKTIAVTGSVGKTTTRHYIACLLGAHYKVHEAPLNYNNLLGVSLSILSAPLDTEYLVLEVGMDGRGQISRISHLIQPDIAVITNIGISHIEKLNSQEEICLGNFARHGGWQTIYPWRRPIFT